VSGYRAGSFREEIALIEEKMTDCVLRRRRESKRLRNEVLIKKG